MIKIKNSKNITESRLLEYREDDAKPNSRNNDTEWKIRIQMIQSQAVKIGNIQQMIEKEPRR